MPLAGHDMKENKHGFEPKQISIHMPLAGHDPCSGKLSRLIP